MGVDYFVERKCPVQRAKTSHGFLQVMVRRRQLQLFSASHAIVDGRPVALVMPEGGLPVHTLRDGAVVATAALAPDDATAVDAELAAWAPKCEGCRARAVEQPFGCYGYIGYPIFEPATELWLVRRAVQMGVVALVSMEVLEKASITGARVTELRARNRSIFASEQPQGIALELSDGIVKLLTSDLLFEVALFQLPTNARLLPLAAVLLGLVPPVTATIEALQSWLTYPAMLTPHLVAPTHTDDISPGLVDYLGAIVAAARTNAPLVVDA